MTQPELRYGIVVNNEDPTGGGRIQVNINYEDKENQELAYAFPLLPKILHITPKKGEAVLIINNNLNDSQSQRFYIGPIISQPQMQYKDDYTYKSATRLLNGSRRNPLPNISYTSAKTLGVLPDTEDVAILGRKDTDIVLKDNELYIRCGVKSTNPYDMTDFSFNGIHPAFIKLQHRPIDNAKVLAKQKTNLALGIEEPKDFESVINVVADKINLISTDSRELYKVNDKKELLGEEQLQKFIKNAHQIPYGDTLVEFLTLFRSAFLNHKHPWAQLVPTKNEILTALDNYDLNSILSQTIRIN